MGRCVMDGGYGPLARTPGDKRLVGIAAIVVASVISGPPLLEP
jgi:hypothetical protein